MHEPRGVEPFLIYALALRRWIDGAIETSKTLLDIIDGFAPICGEAVKCRRLAPQTGPKPEAHQRTGHAEAEDALVLLHQPLQQRALPGSGGAAQHHGPRSRHGSDCEVETGILTAKCGER